MFHTEIMDIRSRLGTDLGGRCYILILWTLKFLVLSTFCILNHCVEKTMEGNSNLITKLLNKDNNKWGHISPGLWPERTSILHNNKNRHPSYREGILIWPGFCLASNNDTQMYWFSPITDIFHSLTKFCLPAWCLAVSRWKPNQDISLCRNSFYDVSSLEQW